MASVIHSLKQALLRRVPDTVYIASVNVRSALSGRAHRVHTAGEGLYRVDDKNGDTIYISQRSRHSHYKRGIAARAERLAGEYRLGSVHPSQGGVLIDCGANVGEIGIWARGRGLEYHAFEPEEREARCCDLNNYGGVPGTHRMGLWHETGELKLYSKVRSADSSLIPIADYDRLIVVKTKTLDRYVEEQGIARIDILKVEAEGAEPEVLRGAERSLRIARYVAVDCGRERGVNNEDTIQDVCNLLYERGFQIIDRNTDRLVLLFENQEAVSARAA